MNIGGFLMENRTKTLFNHFVASCIKDVQKNIDEAEILDSKIFISHEDMNDIIFLIRLANYLNGSSSIPKLIESFDTKYGTINSIIHHRNDERLRYRKKTLEVLIADIERFFEAKLKLVKNDQDKPLSSDASYNELTEKLLANTLENEKILKKMSKTESK